MSATKLRKRNRGRPALPSSDRKSRNFTFRSRGDLRERLDQAARHSGRSISEEIEFRLERSFQNQQSMFEAFEAIYGRGLSGVLLTLGEAMKPTGEHAAFASTHTLQGSMQWWNDPYAFDQAMKAALVVLRAVTPEGQITLPAITRMQIESSELNLETAYENLGHGLALGILREVVSENPNERSARLRSLLGDTFVKRIKGALSKGAGL